VKDRCLRKAEAPGSTSFFQEKAGAKRSCPPKLRATSWGVPASPSDSPMQKANEFSLFFRHISHQNTDSNRYLLDWFKIINFNPVWED
jgi:hypothetical protein